MVLKSAILCKPVASPITLWLYSTDFPELLRGLSVSGEDASLFVSRTETKVKFVSSFRYASEIKFRVITSNISDAVQY